MKKLNAFYEGWGERWHLATLADNGSQLLFEYSPEALRQGLELSPRHLALRPQAYGDFPEHQLRLPGLICDCLPDGWGLLLMDRLFRSLGKDPARVSPLERLAFVGAGAMGALTFSPAEPMESLDLRLNLLAVAKEAENVIADRASQALTALAALGGSPQGARPKVLVHYDVQNETIYSRPSPGSQPWLVKFQAPHETKHACALEQIYAEYARTCGLEMPQTRYFDLDAHRAAFGTARFDVEDGMRVPMHTLSGALHADFRLPGAVDYTTFLRATRFFTRSVVQVKKAYERAVFNVLFNNRDDHPKNHAFRLNRKREWELAPCYDLTFSFGPGGEHYLDVCGEGRAVRREHMLKLASQGGLDRKWAERTMDRMLDAAAGFGRNPQFVSAGRLHPQFAEVVKAVEANHKRLAS